MTHKILNKVGFKGTKEVTEAVNKIPPTKVDTSFKPDPLPTLLAQHMIYPENKPRVCETLKVKREASTSSILGKDIKTPTSEHSTTRSLFNELKGALLPEQFIKHSAHKALSHPIPNLNI